MTSSLSAVKKMREEEEYIEATAEYAHMVGLSEQLIPVISASKNLRDFNVQDLLNMVIERMVDKGLSVDKNFK